jgi:aquaporin Z
MGKYLMEFIGTFFLVLTVTVTVLSGFSNFAPLAIGMVLVALVYAGGFVSGAHYNPAVTLAVWMRGKIGIKEARGYVVMQVIAAIAAGMVTLFLLPAAGDTEAVGLVSTSRGLVAEVLGTFILAFVVLQTATAKATVGNSYYGLAIGVTVLAMAYVFGPISGGAFNPAVAVGVSITHLAAWGDFWIYLVGCFAGGALAAVVFTVVNPTDQ